MAVLHGMLTFGFENDFAVFHRGKYTVKLVVEYLRQIISNPCSIRFRRFCGREIPLDIVCIRLERPDRAELNYAVCEFYCCEISDIFVDKKRTVACFVI